MKQRKFAAFVSAVAAAFPAMSEVPKDHLGFVSEYANYYRIDPVEARRRMLATDRAIEAQTKLRNIAPDSFAGMHIEHTPKFKVVARFTQAPGASARKFMHGDFFQVDSAPYSEIELREALDAISEDLSSRAVRFTAGIDIRKSKVIVEVAPEDAPRIGANYAKGLNSIYEWRTAQGFVTPTFAPYAAYRGADRLWGTTQYCTSGFHSKLADGTPVVTTAGHCDDEIRIWNNTGLLIPRISEKNAGSFDIQWHRYTSSIYYLDPSIQAGSATPDIRAIRTKAQMIVGQHVCKYGHRTFLTCGDIARLDYTHLYNRVLGTYIQVHNQNGDMMTDHGDSGGPVYAWHDGIGYAAYGMVHGRGGDGTSTVKELFFMPSDQFAAAGLSIMLKTN
ncbi:S1 family peptidase [Lysobacter antibioticus]|uniref:S1 family peptidase n=1 Tax=Lysobacter antibioticus TaxID=84531 RepID=UPI00126A67DE|nr:S1 family peptidase [Lysobacter antibioticus]